MPDYTQSKIYKLICNKTGLVYYGSTTQPLYKRKNSHLSDFKLQRYCASARIIVNDDYEIFLVENFPCENVEQLRARERYWIENNECVNKKIPGRTQKEWNTTNKDKMESYYRDYNKKYHQDHKQEIYERKKKLYEKTKIECDVCHQMYGKYFLEIHKQKQHGSKNEILISK